MDPTQPSNAKISGYNGPSYPEPVGELSQLFTQLAGEGVKLDAFLERLVPALGASMTVRVGYHTQDGHQCQAVFFVQQDGGRIFGASLPGPSRSVAIYSNRPEDYGARERFALLLIAAVEAQLTRA